MIATVGPRMNTASASSAAMIILVFERIFTPRVTPLTAEPRNITVASTMMPICEASLTSRPNTVFRPLLICSAPTPSDAATPKAVATTASPLKNPPMCLTIGHGSASVTVLTRATPPRRYWKKAMASATALYTAHG